MKEDEGVEIDSGEVGETDVTTETEPLTLEEATMEIDSAVVEDEIASDVMTEIESLTLEGASV